MEVLRVADGALCEGRVPGARSGLARWAAKVATFTLMCLCTTVGVSSLHGAISSCGRQAGGCQGSMMPVVRRSCGDCSSGACWWCLGRLWMEMAGVCELRSRSVQI